MNLNQSPYYNIDDRLPYEFYEDLPFMETYNLNESSKDEFIRSAPLYNKNDPPSDISYNDLSYDTQYINELLWNLDYSENTNDNSMPYFTKTAPAIMSHKDYNDCLNYQPSQIDNVQDKEDFMSYNPYMYHTVNNPQNIQNEYMSKKQRQQHTWSTYFFNQSNNFLSSYLNDKSEESISNCTSSTADSSHDLLRSNCDDFDFAYNNNLILSQLQQNSIDSLLSSNNLQQTNNDMYAQSYENTHHDNKCVQLKLNCHGKHHEGPTFWGMWEDERSRMLYVSWLPRAARANDRAKKKRCELILKDFIIQLLGFKALQKVLLFPPSSAHCKLLFSTEEAAVKFLNLFGGREGQPGPALWKSLVCQYFSVNIRSGIHATKVRIIWADQTRNDAFFNSSNDSVNKPIC